MAKFPVVKKFLCIFDLQNSIYFISIFNLAFCCFLIYVDANELIQRVEEYKKSLDLGGEKDDSDCEFEGWLGGKGCKLEKVFCGF